MSLIDIKEMLTTHGDRVPECLPKFSSIGCYPFLYLTASNEVYCAKCAFESLSSDDPVIACDSNWEDPNLYCDSCDERIESAYAEDDA